MARQKNTAPAKRPTLQAIADELGVTTMTVSKSLRGIGRISEETRRLVRSKAEEIGYFSSRERLFAPFVRSSTGSENRLRLLCPTLGALDRGESIPYRNDMVMGLERALEKMDGQVVSRSFPSLEEMLGLLEAERFHGVALSEPFPTRWVEALRQHVPVAYTIGHDFQHDVDSVYFNEARAAALVVQQLREAGHQHIGWLGTLDRHAPFLIPDEEFDEEDAADGLSHTGHGTRFASWLYLARQNAGLTPWPVALVERDWRSASLADVVKHGCRILFEARPMPSAIVCVSNAVAREVIRQLEESGFRIPRDISVISYGVEEYGQTDSGVSLTGVNMPMDMVGSLLPEVIQRRLAYPEGLAISIQLDARWSAGGTLRVF
ncbi:MAG: LacI family transcriptional regulator [Verrucomicrobia bacterium 61-8]|nr:LacI family DNA-binding transcriptional regulator [Verrucomicrobiota bacterium]OJV15384.1 MAG: LacI family transcriptional regulator [Verrucomicrobia bacterium 61-8]